MSHQNRRLSLLMCAIASALATSAAAQNPAEQAPVQELQAVTVTGSNIQTTLAAEKQGAPVEVITAQDTQNTGPTRRAKVLANGPPIVGGPAAEQGSGGRGFVNLRGLGTQYTLVLLNGRRLSANDPANTLAIPADAIERVEVLRSGASALYGSDAVAGVVNVILKSRANGLHANVTHGQTTRGGGQTTDINLYGGVESEDSRFFFLINRMTREGVRSADRAITASDDKRPYGGYDARSGIGNPARIGGVTGSGALIADATKIPRGSYSLNPADYRAYDPATDLFDTRAEVNPYVLSAPTRLSVVANFEQDFFDGRATFFANALYWDMAEDMSYGASPAISFADAGIGPIPASNPYNPFGQDLTDVTYRPVELGARPYRVDAFTHRLSGGLRGQVGEWQLEAGTSWYRSGSDQFGSNGIIRSGLKEAINRTGANAFNPFCNQCNSAEQFAGVLGTSAYNIRFESDLVDVRASGPLFELPTGTVQAAAGAEHRREQVKVYTDPLTESGGFVGSSGFTPYDLERDISSVFAEVRIPLMATREGEYESPLELSLAARYEDYSDFGSTSNPLATLRYSTWDDQLTLRASWATAYLAPYLEYASPLYRYPYTETLLDPLTNTAIDAQVYTVGTADIKPETSTTRNFGLILTPKAIPGLTVSLDYYRIRQNDLIPGTDAQSVLNGDTPGRVTRGDGIGPAGEDLIVEAYAYNLGERNMEGYDFAVNYRLPKTAFGDIKLDLSLSRLAKFEIQRLGAPNKIDLAGGYDIAADSFFSAGALPKTRGLFAASWNNGPWGATTQINYMGGYDEMDYDGVATGSHIGSYVTTDLQASYSLGGKRGASPSWLPVDAMRFSLGVENLFDRDVPFVKLINGYNRFENDLRGRFVYARVAVDF